MIEVLPFRAEHLETLTPQPEQSAEYATLTPERARASEEIGVGLTVVADGKTVACAVVMEMAPGRGGVWALVGADAGPHMVTVYRAAQRLFEAAAHRRTEALVLTSFAAGHRFMRLLGFELETPNGMRAFGANGESYSLYAKVT